MTLLLRFWPYIAVALLAMSVFLYISHLKNQIDTRNNKITELSLSIAKQNQYIDELKASADAKLAENRVKIEAAKQEATLYKNRAAALAKKQPTTDNVCKATDELLKEYRAK